MKEASANRTLRDPRWLEGVISKLPLFRQATRRQISEIASHSRTQSLRRGSAVCVRDERLPGVIVVAYGLVKLAFRRDGGEEKVVRFVGANESFGEASVLLGRPSPLHAVALADSMLVVMPQRPLLRLMEFDPKFAYAVARTVAKRHLALLAEFEASVQQRGLQRLGSYLESLADAGGASGVVRLPASKSAIASRLGVTKETLSRLLRELIERRTIAVTRTEIAILDRDALATVARGGDHRRGDAPIPDCALAPVLAA